MWGGGLQNLCQGHTHTHIYICPSAWYFSHTYTDFLMHYTPHYMDLLFNFIISTMCVVCSCFTANKDGDKASSLLGKFCDCVINYCVNWHCIAYMMHLCNGLNSSVVLAGILLYLVWFIMAINSCFIVMLCMWCTGDIILVLCTDPLSAFTSSLGSFSCLSPYLSPYILSKQWSHHILLKSHVLFSVPGSSAAGQGLCDMFDIRLFSSYHIN